MENKMIKQFSFTKLALALAITLQFSGVFASRSNRNKWDPVIKEMRKEALKWLNEREKTFKEKTNLIEKNTENFTERYNQSKCSNSLSCNKKLINFLRTEEAVVELVFSLEKDFYEANGFKMEQEKETSYVTKKTPTRKASKTQASST